jgi:hypothetical protein
MAHQTSEKPRERINTHTIGRLILMDADFSRSSLPSSSLLLFFSSSLLSRCINESNWCGNPSAESMPFAHIIYSRRARLRSGP